MTTRQCEYERCARDLVGMHRHWKVGQLTTVCCRLKLKIFRTLGIDVEADNAGNYNKAVIRNNQKGDVHVVNIDPKFSRYFYANYFWQTMEG